MSKKIPGGQVNFTYTSDEDVELYVECVVSDYDPGVSSGPPERCYPPEGGEVQDVDVFLQDETKLDPDGIPGDTWEAICTRAREEHFNNA